MGNNVSPARLAKMVDAIDRPGITKIDIDIAPDGTVKIRALRAEVGECDAEEALRRHQERQAGLSGNH